MKLNGRQTAGVAFIVGGAAAYLWLMAAEVVPTAVDLAANLGVPVSVSVTWIGLVTRQSFLPDASVDFAVFAPCLTVDSALRSYDDS